MKTTIELAREAAGDEWYLFREFMPEIHRLAELVRADERARMAENARELGLHYDPAQHGPVHSTQISKVWWGVKENT